LLRLDLATGAETLLGRVPGGNGGGLVVTGDRIYAPDPERDRVWVGDRQGRPLRTISAGRYPLSIALLPAPAADR